MLLPFVLRVVAGACVGRRTGQARMPPRERRHDGLGGLGVSFRATCRLRRGRHEGVSFRATCRLRRGRHEGVSFRATCRLRRGRHEGVSFRATCRLRRGRHEGVSFRATCRLRRGRHEGVSFRATCRLRRGRHEGVWVPVYVPPQERTARGGLGFAGARSWIFCGGCANFGEMAL